MIDLDDKIQESPQEMDEATHEITHEAIHEATHEKCEEACEHHTEIASDKPEAATHTPVSNKRYMTFLEQQEALKTLPEKLHAAIEFMTETLSVEHGAPHFKSFWDARLIALELFKEYGNTNDRAELWDKYSNLSKEARRLKSILDEQSAFASEQIDMAIVAIETELDNTPEALEKIHNDDFLENCQSLSQKKQSYYDTQRLLNLLNAQGGRITALRKELIRTEMRVKQKNKFFQRLSALGDRVFPKRKELIKQISEQFYGDVDAFIAKHFGPQESHEGVFYLREEIKALQGVAKKITINTQTFSHTREVLSESWDKLKVIDKDRKKVRAEQKEQFRQHVEIFEEKIKALSHAIENNEVNNESALEDSRKIFEELQQTTLGRDEYFHLKTSLGIVQKQIHQRLEAEETLRREQNDEKERQKRSKINELRQEIESFISSLTDFDADQISLKRDELQAKIAGLSATKIEKLDLEKLLKPVKEALVDLREKALLNLSADDRNAILQLKEMLQCRCEQRQEIRERIEALRKAKGASGQDFEHAMQVLTLESSEKELLDKVNHTISEIENKLASLSQTLS